MKNLFFFVLANVVLGSAAFAQDAGDFVTRIDSQNGVQTLIITGYTGKNKDIVIPAFINNLAVKTIGERAFELKGLTSVVIPEGIECIAQRAFYGNKLARVDIPNSVRIIADSAFDSNLLLKVVDGASVTVNVPSKTGNNMSGVYYVASEINSQTAAQQSASGYDDAVSQLRMQQNFYSPVSVNLNTVAAPKPTSPVPPPLPQRNTSNTFIGLNNNSQYDDYEHESGYDECGSEYDVYSPPSYSSSKEKDNAKVAAYKEAADQYADSDFTYEYKVDESVVSKEPDRNISSQSRLFTVSRTKDGENAIVGFTGYQSAISLPNNIGNTKISVISKRAFAARQLTFVSIPEGYTYIGTAAFMSNSLMEVTIPKSIQYIGSQAFIGNNLQAITIGADVVMESDSFSYRFADYYKMAGSRAGTYIFKAGQWDLNGVERVNYNVNRRR
ncbi:MAG: hypothetical protein Ta2B_23440 [Termitinemataceae bacterium]|nr:MAG: hypothetical protein Ta2B_23440 [Termitinemataceae bacterium]